MTCSKAISPRNVQRSGSESIKSNLIKHNMKPIDLIDLRYHPIRKECAANERSRGIRGKPSRLLPRLPQPAMNAAPNSAADSSNLPNQPQIRLVSSRCQLFRVSQASVFVLMQYVCTSKRVSMCTLNAGELLVPTFKVSETLQRHRRCSRFQGPFQILICHLQLKHVTAILLLHLTADMLYQLLTCFTS